MNKKTKLTDSENSKVVTDVKGRHRGTKMG